MKELKANVCGHEDQRDTGRVIGQVLKEGVFSKQTVKCYQASAQIGLRGLS